MKKDSRIFVAGQGLVGSALIRNLQSKGFRNVIVRPRKELDLLDQKKVHTFFQENKVEYVFLAAARVGGIFSNSQYQADFLYENLVIATNVIHAAAVNNTEKLLYLGSSCIYPRMAPQPIPESALLSGPLETTNEGYAIAKIAGLKLCEMYQRQYGKKFISAMPTNLYGPNDNFHPENSHVIPGMMRRFHEAKEAGKASVNVWGTGKALREFLHVDDLAEALVLLVERYDGKETVNVGTGEESSILELAKLMKKVTGFAGDIEFDTSKPDGTPRKILDSGRIQSFGWKHRISLSEGLKSTYQWALETGTL